MNYNYIRKKTCDKFESGDFMVGDIFSEMLSYWQVIIKVEGDQLTLITGSSKNLKMSIVTKDQFTKSCQYKNTEGYWIDFMKNDIKKASDYLEAYCEQSSLSQSDIRELKLDLIL